MAHSYRVKPRGGVGNALEDIRREALESPSVELRRVIRAQSVALAGKMVQLHDAACHVRIEDDFSFVLVMRDLEGID